MADDSTPPAAPPSSHAQIRASIDRYWRRNVVLMTGLLVVWATVSLGFGVLFADALNEIRFGGFRLGFWFAHQGSILVFVLLILIYALVMRRLDLRHHAELEALSHEGQGGAGASQ